LIGNTTRKEFNTVSNWIPTNQLTEVYTGTYTFTTGINVIKFDRQFSYDGINNLVIAIDENSTSKQSGQCSFDATYISDNRTLSIDGSNYGKVFHYDGTSWTELKSGAYEHLNCVWGVSSTSLYAAGDKGHIIQYDGTNFTQMDTRVAKNLYAMWGSSASDFYIVGENGTIMHYSNKQFSRLTPGVSNSLFGIWGTSASDIYIVGSEGLILHYDGNDFTTMTNTDTSDLHSVWGSDANNIFAVGNHTGGCVLYYE